MELSNVKFVICSTQRAGSHMVASSLDNHPELSVIGELFVRPGDYQVKFAPVDEMVRKAFERFNGFISHRRVTLRPQIHKQFKNSFALWSSLLKDFPHIKVIYLKRRDVLGAFLSFRLSQLTGVWQVSQGPGNWVVSSKRDMQWCSPKYTPEQTITVDPDSLLGEFLTKQEDMRHFDKLLAKHGGDVLDLYYEDLVDNFHEEMKRVYSFLGISDVYTQPSTVKQEVRPKREIVSNWDKLTTHFEFERIGWRKMFPIVEKITVIMKTFKRPLLVCRALASVRAFYPNLRVIVADDSDDASADLCKQACRLFPQVEHLRLPFDVGLSAGRNAALDQVESPYVFLMDDDHVFSSNTNLERLYQVCSSVSDPCDIVGLKVLDGLSKQRLPWEGYLNLSDDKEELQFHKLANREIMGGMRCDVVHNCFLAKTASVKSILWADNLKILEHVEFFYRAKQNRLVVRWLPGVQVNHLDVPDDGSYAEYDEFREGRYNHYRKLMLETLGVKRFHIFPTASGEAKGDTIAGDLDKL